MARIVTGRKDTPENEVLPWWPEPEFLLMWHPEGWDYLVTGTDEETGELTGEWLPQIVKFPFTPGVNGVKEGGDYHQAKSEYEKQGWVFLDPHIVILRSNDDGRIVKENGYRQIFNGVRGDIWTDIWSRPVLMGSGNRKRVDWVADYDNRGKLEWRRYLVAKEIIPLPDPAVLEHKIKIQSRRASRRASDAHAGAPPQLLAAQDAKEAKLAAMKRDASQITTTKRIKGRRDAA